MLVDNSRGYRGVDRHKYTVLLHSQSRILKKGSITSPIFLKKSKKSFLLEEWVFFGVSVGEVLPGVVFELVVEGLFEGGEEGGDCLVEVLAVHVGVEFVGVFEGKQEFCVYWVHFGLFSGVFLPSGCFGGGFLTIVARVLFLCVWCVVFMCRLSRCLVLTIVLPLQWRCLEKCGFFLASVQGLGACGVFELRVLVQCSLV